MKRVVLTGAGTVNALAADVPGTWAAMAKGRAAIGPLDLPDFDRLQIRIAAQVKGFDPTQLFAPETLARLDRVSQFALVAAREALLGAGLSPGPVLARAGVILGNAGGGHETQDAAYRAVYGEGKARVAPLTVPRLMSSAGASAVSMEYGLQGPTFSVGSACASSNHAIGLAFHLVRSGAMPVMLAGGAEAMLTFGGLKAWESLRVLSPDGCRPFDKARNGMVMGEGAAIFVLEERDHALARGARPLAEIAGFAMGADAESLLAPSAEGAGRAMRGALADAGLSPSDVGYVNAHGTGTMANDLAEAQAIGAVFGAGGPLVSSTKGMHGHAIGAAGALELLAVLLALSDGVVPPTAGLHEADADCALRHVIGQAERAWPEACLSNTFAFGGLNAVLALRRHE